ncbi:MAG: hypothetical protein ACYSUH_04505, partial [Planctomycetota bacterium]
LKAFSARSQFKFRKKSKIFTDRRTALSDKGTDITDSAAGIQVLFPKILKNIRSLSFPPPRQDTQPVAPTL